MLAGAQAHVVQIPAMQLAAAFDLLAEQTNISISWKRHDPRGLFTRRVTGRMTPSQALSVLLADSPLTFQQIDAATFLIVRKPVAPATAAAAHVPQPGAAPVVALQDVIVTATKRTSAAASELPYAISAIPARQLAAGSVRSSAELADFVPALQFTNLGPGHNKAFIRGMADSNFPGNTQASVSEYIDEYRILYNAPDPDLYLVDIDRVEVLRGPQGTLYGAGSLTGIYRLVTRKPSLRDVSLIASAGASFTKTDAHGYSADIIANVPIVDGKLAARGVAYADMARGYLDNIGTKQHHANSSHRIGGRFGLKWQVSDDWDFTLQTATQLLNARDAQYENTGTPGTRRTAIPEPHDNDFSIIGATITGTVGKYALTSSTAWNVQNLETRYDASQSAGFFNVPPATNLVFTTDKRTRFVTNETRIQAGAEARFQWIAGFFLSNGTSRTREGLAAPAAATPAYADTRMEDIHEYALFAEVPVRFAEKWTATLGGRFYYYTVGQDFVIAAPAAQDSIAVRHISRTDFMPRVLLEYRPDARMLVYAGYSEGYRLGGINARAARAEPVSALGADEQFPSDQLKSFEIGGKAKVLEGKAEISAALFRAKWKNIQSDQVLPNGLLDVINAGDGKIVGMEAAAEYVPTQNLHVGGQIFLNSGEVSRINPLLSSVDDPRLPGIAKVSFGTWASYEHDLGSVGTVTASLRYYRQGRSHLNFDPQASGVMDRSDRLSFNAAYAHNNWTISITGQNLLNDHRNSLAFGNPFSYRQEQQITPLRPRTFAVRFSSNW